MEQPHSYTVTVSGDGAKTGLLGSPDPLPDLAVTSPPQFGGPAGVWSPEHLFVAAVGACLMITFRAVAGTAGLEILDYEDTAVGELIRDENRLYRMSVVRLRPRVTISDPDKVEQAMRLIDKAEQACVISRSINSRIQVEPEILVAATV